MFGSMQADLYKIWKIFDPRRTLIALFGGLAVLALLIHFILLSTANFNWLDTAYATPIISNPPVVKVAPVVKAAPVAAKPAPVVAAKPAAAPAPAAAKPAAAAPAAAAPAAAAPAPVVVVPAAPAK
jgi:light-harvesting complex 1 alpha chain